MGYSSTRGMAALRMARTALDHIIFEKIDPNDDLHEFRVRLSIIEQNLAVADEKGLSAATRPSWKRLQKLRDGLGEIIR